MAIRQTRAAVVGVGHSKVYRHDDVSLGVLSIDACLKAIEDAGLVPGDIDGVVVDPLQPVDPFDGSGVDGRQKVGPEYIIQALNLDVSWYEACAGSMSGTMIEAANAVASGICNYVLAFRALHNPRGRYGRTNPASSGGVWGGQYTGPYGLYAPAIYAHLWTRYMFEYGTSREQMAPFIVNNRKNALLWEHGYWYQHRPVPLTEEDYLAGRMISSPISLFDCDIPIQACGAFVLTSPERAKDLPHEPAYIRGWAMPGIVGGPVTARSFDLIKARGARFSQQLFENSGIKPSDVDIANVYDGFSIFVPLWLEALGFCKDGEAFDFMTSERIALDGDFPVNTSSGNLGAGRTHGVPHFMDSVLQIMGRSGPRQVKKRVDIALTTAGGAPGNCAGMVFSSCSE